MSTPLVMALRENCGYLRDEGWQQTAQLMLLAATEIERINERLRELEAQATRLDPPQIDGKQDIAPLIMPVRRRR